MIATDVPDGGKDVWSIAALLAQSRILTRNELFQPPLLLRHSTSQFSMKNSMFCQQTVISAIILRILYFKKFSWQEFPFSWVFLFFFLTPAKFEKCLEKNLSHRLTRSNRSNRSNRGRAPVTCLIWYVTDVRPRLHRPDRPDKVDRVNRKTVFYKHFSNFAGTNEKIEKTREWNRQRRIWTKSELWVISWAKPARKSRQLC